MPRKLRIISAFPQSPPAIDGIGDHTSRLLSAISEFANVKFITLVDQPTPIDGVEIIKIPKSQKGGGSDKILMALNLEGGDWFLLPYNPFSWGRWGLALKFVLKIRKAVAKNQFQLALLLHETYVMPTSWKFAIMTVWQRVQLRVLATSSSVIFVSTTKWLQHLPPSIARSRIVHLPVGSNIKPTSASRNVIRANLGISETEIVLGIFGMAHPTRGTDGITACANALAIQGIPCTIICIGSILDVVRNDNPTLRVIGGQGLSEAEVTDYFAAIDISLSLFKDGVSTRRGSFMAALAHGIPAITTIGLDTDDILLRESGTCFEGIGADNPEELEATVVALALDRNRRTQMGALGRALYESQFDWTILARIVASNMLVHERARPKSHE